MSDAFDTFFIQAAAENLPAAVPVASVAGDSTGIVTTRFDVRLNEDALKYAASDDPADRALCAVYACRTAREAVDSTEHLQSA